MQTLSRNTLSAGAFLMLFDTALAALAWPIAVWLTLWNVTAMTPPDVPALTLFPAFCLLFLYGFGLYRRDALLQIRRSLCRAAVAVMMGGMLALFAVATLPPPFAASGWALLFVAAVPCFTLTTSFARIALSSLQRRGLFRRRLLVIGAGERAYDMTVLLGREGRRLGYDISMIQYPPDAPVDRRLQADPTCRILSAAGGYLAIAKSFSADQIVVTPDDRRGLPMEALLRCRTAGYPVCEYHTFLEKEIGRIDMKRLDLGWLLYSEGFVFGPLDRALKRLLDVGVSLVLLLLTAPALVTAALAVKLEDGGPVLYWQARVTQGGRIFRIMKLRTMRTDAEKAGAVWATVRDPRVTWIGNFLRRTRLDELPQLINVLRGDMSFVGPRPERPEFTADLGRELPLYEERHLVRAGLTGWAQVNYPYGASLDDSRSKLSYDLYYVKNFGVLFDIQIILQTLRVVLWPGNAVR